MINSSCWTCMAKLATLYGIIGHLLAVLAYYAYCYAGILYRDHVVCAAGPAILHCFSIGISTCSCISDMCTMTHWCMDTQVVLTNLLNVWIWLRCVFVCYYRAYWLYVPRTIIVWFSYDPKSVCIICWTHCSMHNMHMHKITVSHWPFSNQFQYLTNQN